MQDSRRKFLKSLMAVAAGAAVGPKALGRMAASEIMGIGIIGTGDLGRHHHLNILKGMPDVRIVALADVDRRHLDAAAGALQNKVKTFSDYRRLLDDHEVDAVLIATPDHWHALNTIHACEAGKHVYCEKPLSLTVAEGRAMVDAARRNHRIVQVGTQQRSDDRFHRACEMVRNGHIGTITQVRACLGTAPKTGFHPDTEPPAELDWNAWLGPAPFVPYNERRCHYNFRWFFDYSGGKLSDWGAHHIDIAQWGLGREESGPTRIEGRGVFPGDNFYEVPVDFDLLYTYDDGVRLVVTSEGENGVTFKGTKGEIFVSRQTLRTSDPDLAKRPAGDFGAIRLPYSRHHHQNWLNAIRNHERPVADIEYGHRSATLAHLGNMAIRLGRSLSWNPDNESFVGDSEANRLRSRPNRSPWSRRS